MKLGRIGLPMIASLVLGVFGPSAKAQVPEPPNPGVVVGGFCTYGTGFFKNSTQAAVLVNQYFGLGAIPPPPALPPEFFHVGTSPNTYTWQKTGTLVTIGKGNQSAEVDSGVAALQQAVGSTGNPGEFSQSETNPTDMGTGAILGAQALALKINQSFSEEFLTPATGFSGLSLVNMDGVKLGGAKLTSAQANALNGQATLQVRDAADVALGLGTLPYGLSFSQLTDLIYILNTSFDSCGSSKFAQTNLYQPYATSNAFAGKRPSTVSDFASKPVYNTFSGEVVAVGDGCTAASYTNVNFPHGKIALIERGTCTFQAKVQMASDQGASAAIIFNNTEGNGSCPAPPIPGSTRCEALVGMGGSTPNSIPIPAAFVQRSTGLKLRNGAAVTAFVQQ